MCPLPNSDPPGLDTAGFGPRWCTESRIANYQHGVRLKTIITQNPFTIHKLWVCQTRPPGSLHEVFQRCRSSSSADPSMAKVFQGCSEAPSNLGGFRTRTHFPKLRLSNFFSTSTHSGRRCKTVTPPPLHIFDVLVQCTVAPDEKD